MIAGRVALALLGAIVFLLGAAGIDAERHKVDGAPTLALAFACIGAAVFVAVFA